MDSRTRESRVQVAVRPAKCRAGCVIADVSSQRRILLFSRRRIPVRDRVGCSTKEFRGGKDAELVVRFPSEDGFRLFYDGVGDGRDFQMRGRNLQLSGNVSCMNYRGRSGIEKRLYGRRSREMEGLLGKGASPLFAQL